MNIQLSGGLLLQVARAVMLLVQSQSVKKEFPMPPAPEITTVHVLLHEQTQTSTAPTAPYAHTSQPDYSGISQLSAAGKGCLACGSDHLSSATAALTEAIRFARTGDIIHPEVVSRITLAMDELNAFERIDGAPEKVTKLPLNEKNMMDSMMAASREIRHHITDIKNPDDLEKTAALARQYRIYFMAKQIKMQKAVTKSTETAYSELVA